MNRFNQPLFIAFLMLLIILGCAKVPVTGRSQLNVYSDQELITVANEDFNRFMTLVSKKNAVLSPSDSAKASTIIENVNVVSNRIIDAAGLRDRLNWETVVVNSKEANAFVMPNGKIVVFTGLLQIAKTPAGLAAVIGHEVAHVAAHHQAERVSQVLVTQLALKAAEVAFILATANSPSNSKYQPVIGTALGLGALYGFLLPFSREHESEADRIGLYYMAKAGFDPSEAVDVWERMEAKGGSGPWEFLSTHPSHATRIVSIREWLPEANLYFADPARPLPSNLAEVKAAQAQQSSRMVFAPVAPLPLHQPGFWYQYKVHNDPNPLTFRYDRKESCSIGECIILTKSDGGISLLTAAEYAQVEVRKPDGSWTKFFPPFQYARFPLRVGDSWTQEIVVETSAGRKMKMPLKGRTVSYESVTVPAGSFMAYKITLSAHGFRIMEAWYSPETRTAVRVIDSNPKGRDQVRELMDYQRSYEPAGALNTNSK